MFWNPAGLAVLEEHGLSDVSAAYNMLLETSYAGSIAYGRPLGGGRGALGASLVYFSQSALQGYDAKGDPTSSFTPSDLAFGLGYGRVVGPVRAGAGLKFIRSELAGASGTTFAVDLGVQAERVTEMGEGPLDVGASLVNLGPPLKLGGASDPLPFKVQLGTLWHINPRLNGMLDGHLPVDDDPYASFGLEFRQVFAEDFRASLRGGYNVRNERGVDGLAGMSAGFGVELLRGRIDYAWVPFGDLGMTHRITLGFKF
jgi:hypothetical protein